MSDRFRALLLNYISLRRQASIVPKTPKSDWAAVLRCISEHVVQARAERAGGCPGRRVRAARVHRVQGAGPNLSRGGVVGSESSPPSCPRPARRAPPSRNHSQGGGAAGEGSEGPGDTRRLRPDAVTTRAAQAPAAPPAGPRCPAAAAAGCSLDGATAT